jgi:hypothetical protein
MKCIDPLDKPSFFKAFLATGDIETEPTANTSTQEKNCSCTPYQLDAIAHRYTNSVAFISSDSDDTCNKMMPLKVCFCWPRF